MKMKLIFSVFVLIISEHFHVCSFLIQESLEEKEWEVFKQTHGKSFENAVEENYRKQTYFNNKLMILNYHLEHGPQPDFTLNLNTFGDLMHSEFISQRNGFFHKAQKDLPSGSTYIPAANVQIPDEVDWRILGAVTPMKDQGNCGSCWAFSATGSLEGQHFRKTGKLVSLSEQNLVDCSGKFGNNGCNGGLMNNAFTYVKYNKGIDTEVSYPYKAKDGKCKFSNATIGATCTGFVDLPKGNETALKIAVATLGPISVAIDASPATFQFYHSGIYYDHHCSSVDLDHGVLVVGYGSKNGKDYWIIKNSWGTTWGQEGYFYLARNKHNHCGVATSASFPLV